MFSFSVHCTSGKLRSKKFYCLRLCQVCCCDNLSVLLAVCIRDNFTLCTSERCNVVVTWLSLLTVPSVINKLCQHQQRQSFIHCAFYYSFAHTCFGTIAILREITTVLLKRTAKKYFYCCTFNNIGVNSLRMAIVPKHVRAYEW